MSDSFILPSAVRSCLLDDAAFAEAYASVSAERRAMLKTCIARLWTWYGRDDSSATDSSVRWRGGLVSRLRTEPVDYSLTILDSTVASPSKMLAALVPAIVAGVGELVVIRLADAPWPDEMLVALELAGVEQVVDATLDDLEDIADSLLDSPARGAVVALGEDLALEAVDLFGNSPGAACWYPTWGDIADVWVEDEAMLEELAATYPDISFSVYNASRLPAGAFTAMEGDYDLFVNELEEVCFAPDHRLEAVPARVRLALGDSAVGSWLWPDLPVSIFRKTSASWTSGADS